MENNKIYIAPSILSANFSKMGEECIKLEQNGADILHCDIMDGVFVPNITFGIKMIEDLKKTTNLPLDCHLMIVEPYKYVEKFAKAGADYITVHYEACKEKLQETLQLIKSFNVKCGLVINPDTDVELIKDQIEYCDIVLLMSVFPGFGGQKYIESVTDKIIKTRKIIDEINKNILLEVDGGITIENVKTVKQAGANVIVAGSTIFNSINQSQTIKLLRQL